MDGKHRKNRIVVSVGMKGAGKTQLNILEFRKAERAIVLDSMEDYDGRDGYVVSGHLETVDYLRGTERFRVVYRPLEDSDFDFVCDVVWKAKNVLFVVEELGRYCNTASIPKRFDDIVARGRHRCISLMVSVQRFQMIHRNVTAMADEYYLFRQAEPNDLDEVERRFGKDVSRIVRDLDDLEAVHIKTKEFRAHVAESFSVVSVVPRSGVFPHRAQQKGSVNRERIDTGKLANG